MDDTGTCGPNAEIKALAVTIDARFSNALDPSVG
jgi:hypothetical protein